MRELRHRPWKAAGSMAVAALLGYLGGPALMDLLRLVLGDDSEGIHFFVLALGSLFFVFGLPVFLAVFGLGLVAHKLLETAQRFDLVSYIAAGVAYGLFCVGVTFGLSARGAFLGVAALAAVPSGAAAGAVFWVLRRPDLDAEEVRRGSRPDRLEL